jgi:hypothetical protein
MPEGWATTEVSLLDQILDATKPMAKSERALNKTYLEEFIGFKKATEGQLVSQEVEDNLKHWIGEIDEQLASRSGAGEEAARQKLEERRDHLKELLAKMPGNDKLDQLLSDVLANADKAKKLVEEMEVAPPVQGACAVPLGETRTYKAARGASGFWFWLILLAVALGGLLWYIWR